MYKIPQRILFASMSLAVFFSSCKKDNATDPLNSGNQLKTAAAQTAVSADKADIRHLPLLDAVTTTFFYPSDFGIAPATQVSTSAINGVVEGGRNTIILKVNNKTFTYAVANGDMVSARSTIPENAHWKLYEDPNSPIEIRCYDKNASSELKFNLIWYFTGYDKVFIITNAYFSFNGLANGRPIRVVYNSAYSGFKGYVKVKMRGDEKAQQVACSGTFDSELSNVTSGWAGGSRLRVSGSFNVN